MNRKRKVKGSSGHGFWNECCGDFDGDGDGDLDGVSDGDGDDDGDGNGDGEAWLVLEWL